MSPNPDICWKQRFQNVDRAFVLIRDAMENGPSALDPLEQTIEAIPTRYPSGIGHLQDFMRREAMK